MSDLIDRQEAIEAVADYIHNVDIVMGNGTLSADDCIYAAESVLENLPSAQPAPAFITWLLDEIWDEDMWELNWQSFPEILCRKMAKLGYIRERNGEYERLDQ